MSDRRTDRVFQLGHELNVLSQEIAEKKQEYSQKKARLEELQDEGGSAE